MTFISLLKVPLAVVSIASLPVLSFMQTVMPVTRASATHPASFTALAMVHSVRVMLPLLLSHADARRATHFSH